ncbi:MAG: caspase family protein [Ignavibacteria bacterium]|nr:caspase family protein [Ignavibacteria bacterium]
MKRVIILSLAVLLINISFAQAPMIVVQTGHTSKVTSVCFSPDGNYILSGSSDKTVKLWDISNGKEIRNFTGHTRSVNSVCFSPDGKFVLSGSGDGTLKLWDISNGKEIRTFDGSTTGVNSVCFSPDGKYILSGGDYFDPTVKLWEISSRKEVRIFKGNFRFPNSINFSPDGKFAIISEGSQSFSLWNVSTGKEIRTFKGHTSAIYSLEFSPNGKYILSGSNDSTLKLWEFSSGKEIRTFVGHKGCVFTVSFSPDGKYALSGSGDNTLKLWDISTGKEIRTFEGHQDWITSVDFSSDGKHILSGSSDNTLKLWNLSNGKEIRKFEGYTSVITSIDFSPDGKYILSGCYDSTLKLWDITTSRLVQTFKGHSDKVLTVSFSPDGKYVLSGSQDRTLKLWETSNGKEIRTFEGHQDWITSVDFSSDGKHILSGSSDNTLRLWNISSGKVIKTYEGENSYVICVCFSPDGKYILSGYDLGFPTLWDVSTGNEIKSFHEVNVSSLCFSPDSRYALLGDGFGNLSLWEISTGDKIRTFKGHKGEIFYAEDYGHNVASVSFSPDGKFALTGSEDKTLKLWDISTGKEMRTFEGHTDGVTSVCFSPDGKYALSGGWDNKIILWIVDSGKDILSFVPINKDDFLIYTPDNYYTCSKGGYKGVGFRFRNHSYPFEQFDLQFNRPDIVLEKISYAQQELINAYKKAYEKRLLRMNFTEDMFNEDFHLPEIKILNEDIPLSTTEKNISFEVRAKDSKYSLDKLNVFVNEVPILGTSGITLREDNINKYECEISLELSNLKNNIQISVLNEKGVESLKETFEINYEGILSKPDLYILSIGVSDYNNDNFDLKYASKDAKDIVTLFERNAKGYEKVNVLEIIDKEATKGNIIKAKEFLMQTKVDDVVVVFLSGHGLLDDSLNYYYATTDIEFKEPHIRGLSYEEVEKLLDGIPARKKILLMDTCNSGEVDKTKDEKKNDKDKRNPELILENKGVVRSYITKGQRLLHNQSRLGLSNSFELMRELFSNLSRGSGTVVISAAGGKEYAFESSTLSNGIFTYSVIDGLINRNADINDNGEITVSELRDYVIDKVQELTNYKQKPTVRQERIEFDFVIMNLN